MRLLLLLSAILSALTGVAGGRAVAQPVPATFAAPATVARAAVAKEAVIGVPLPAFATRPPLTLGPRLVSATIARILYAERRRE